MEFNLRYPEAKFTDSTHEERPLGVGSGHFFMAERTEPEQFLCHRLKPRWRSVRLESYDCQKRAREYTAEQEEAARTEKERAAAEKRAQRAMARAEKQAAKTAAAAKKKELEDARRDRWAAESAERKAARVQDARLARKATTRRKKLERKAKGQRSSRQERREVPFGAIMAAVRGWEIRGCT